MDELDQTQEQELYVRAGVVCKSTHLAISIRLFSTLYQNFFQLGFEIEKTVILKHKQCAKDI